MTGDVLLGADLGTSGLKLVALDAAGAVVAEAEREYGYDRPGPGRAEIEVAVWRSAVDAALADVVADLGGRAVRALGLSGQMHGTVLVDAAGRPVRPAVLWPDARATAEAQRWTRLAEADRAALPPPAPGMTGPVLAWLAAHEPGALERAVAVLLPKDALRASLVPDAEVAVTDRSDASGTLLWDVAGEGWSPSAVAAAGVPAALLPAVRPGAEVVGTTPVAGAAVPVVVGAADTPLALLAAGATSGLQVNLGTGAQVLRPGWTPQPVAERATAGLADALDGWYAMAALQNGGSAWAWVRDVLGMSWAEFFAAAEGAAPGAGGVVFRPFLTGERGGVAGPGDRGGWSGLSAVTTRADLARAAVEGVAAAIGAAARSLAVPDDGRPVVVTGGGARSAVVQQALADALGRPVRHLPMRSASAIGAAVLAGRGVGAPVEPERRPGPVVEPRPGV
ncbi:FGGY family carbohydrate kinase [Blastococcus sp. SYSU D01042]